MSKLSMREVSEKKLVSELKKKEEYEEVTEPVFSTDAGFVSLTFDDGPSTHTERLLEYLSEKGVRAIFFLIGENVKRFPQLARKIAEAGHVIGNHSYSHAAFTKLSQEQKTSELTRTNQLIADITGVGPRYFRPPYGAYDESTLALVRKENMKVVMWSADPRDYVFNTSSAVFRATEPLVSSRKILLLHDLKRASIDATPQIVDYILKKGLEVTKEFEK